MLHKAFPFRVIMLHKGSYKPEAALAPSKNDPKGARRVTFLKLVYFTLGPFIKAGDDFLVRSSIEVVNKGSHVSGRPRIEF